MNIIKRHLALILPLIGLLFSLQSLLLINRAIASKEDTLVQNYSVLIASLKILNQSDLSPYIKNIKSIEQISSDFLIDRFKDISDSTEAIRAQLPFFYSIKLARFPNDATLKKIESTLKTLPFVSHYETFSKTHNQVYKLLLFTKTSVVTFSALLFVLSFMLMLRVVQIWRFEHQERILIMTLLGASSWLKHKVLVKLALIDSLISALLISIAILGFKNSGANDILQSLGVDSKIFHFQDDFILMLSTALIVSLTCVIMAILFRQKRY